MYQSQTHLFPPPTPQAFPHPPTPYSILQECKASQVESAEAGTFFY